MKYFNVTFKWYDTDTYCSNIAKAECVEDVKAHYSKFDNDPIISEASSYEVEAAQKRGKPIIACPHIEATAEVEAEAEPEHEQTESENDEAQTEPSRPTPAAKPTSRPQVDREALRREFCKAWDSPRMIDYCVNKVAAVAVLPSGEIITVDKQSIEKDFCFGESGYDYDEAQSAAAHARKSESYFKRENMKHFNEWLKDLDEVRTMSGNYALVIGSKQYTGQSEDCKLAFVEFVRLSELIDACGGSCYLEELPGKVLTVRGCSRRVATPEEIDLITEAYKTAAAQHEKKVDSYLKRYGTSKVNAWTYWRDA